ncbi:peptidoglycan DD-metalloendopeptidase family protein [Patescibacteria group bacterium]|nr:peptidoglycan DD-metalloendopeptidase family protein [Patescibacteria group bacterium]MBU1952714.1 peptidoglycan DD-metalloendopeptidase family protein [Patescibacteria group bacterium]
MKQYLKYLTVLAILITFSSLFKTGASWIKTGLASQSITSLENTPFGILAGELNTNIWEVPPPKNALYISKDLGQTWQTLGLSGRGITDIKYYDGKIYATTYYTQNNTNGLFVSSDKGATWSYIGPPYSTNKVTTDSQTIYLGTENCGLWISKDKGDTWTQRIGISCDGTKIYALASSDNLAIVATLRSVYRSVDHGETWTEMSSLLNKSLYYFAINESEVFAGSSATTGIYASMDLGTTWNKVDSFGNYAVGNITHFRNKYYVGRQNPINQTYTVYSTSNLGNTWENTGLEISDPFNKTRDINWIYSEPAYLFAAVLYEGVYRYQLPEDSIPKLPIFDIPWTSQGDQELIDKITAYFDHSYPLLGYAYFVEPESDKTTTQNFLGYKDSEPNIYYSSHSGTDFALKYGTEIVAPASGYASYYYCSACGNTIKIDHPQGYQSIYEHLQSDELITKYDKVWVNAGDKIGKVGMTGKTSGPHLHFEILRDLGLDGDYLNDFPIGRVDPFGWQSLISSDPWKNFTWNDSLGNHRGSESSYLWKTDIGKNSRFISSGSNPEDSDDLVLDNKKVSFENFQNSAKNFTAKIVSYIQPTLNSVQKNLKYIESTSFILEAFDQSGDIISNFDNLIKISIQINPLSLSNVITSTIKLYYWNQNSGLWESLESTFDTVTNTLTSYTNHFSKFAAFAEKADILPPETVILVQGDQLNGWFVEYPLINLSCDNEESTDIEGIFYSIDDGETWELYKEPILIQKEGVTDFLYKSQDINGNMEDTKNYVIRVNTQGKITKTIKVIGSRFETNN